MKITCVFGVAIACAATSAHAESLQAYANRCAQAIGAPIPEFSCFDGTVIPITGEAGGKCDNPALFNDSCVKYSRLGRIPVSDDVMLMFMCRRYTERPEYDAKFEDIAVIAHNKKTGDTCFFQTPEGIPRNGRKVPAPMDGDEDYWLSPRQTARESCAGCHDNDAFIRTPYVDQVKDHNALPQRTVSELRSGPYRFVGPDFKNWHVYEVQTNAVDGCSRCHRMGLFRNGNDWAYDLGTTQLLGPQAAGLLESPARNQSNHGHPWMPAQHRAHAEILRKCVEGILKHETPPGCVLKPIR